MRPWILLALVACGGGNTSPADAPVVVDTAKADGLAFQDAPAGAFGCLGQPLPTTAPDPLTVGGTAQTLNGLATMAASNVLVAAFRSGNGTALTSATTPTDGTFSLSIVSGAVPLDGYIKATKAGLLDYYLYPGTPLAANLTGAPVLVLSQSSIATVETLGSVTPAADPATVGLLAVVVRDCAGAAVAGATISVQENGSDVGDRRYVAGSLPSANATATDSKGTAFFFNVPPGTATISAHVANLTLRAHMIPITAGASHATTVEP